MTIRINSQEVRDWSLIPGTLSDIRTLAHLVQSRQFRSSSLDRIPDALAFVLYPDAVNRVSNQIRHCIDSHIPFVAEVVA